MRVTSFWPGIVVLMLSQLAHADMDCATAAAIATIGAARERLLATPGGELDPFLSPGAQENIERLKDGVVSLVGSQMHCAVGAEDPRMLAHDLEGALGSLPKRIGDGCDAAPGIAQNPYCDLPGFEARRWPQHQRLLGIVARIPIECGTDAMLFVYEYADGSWQQRLLWRSKPYSQVSGAFEAFDYLVSPPDKVGGWYVLTKNIAPWCSSTWSSIRYAVLRPSPASAKVVFQSDDEIWWGSDDFGSIAANAQDFEVRFHASSIDMGVHNRVWIRHFLIDGARVQRVQPVALTPRDFVDEWIRSPWQQASRWSAPHNKTLHRWHERLRGKDSPIYDYEFIAARACSDAASYEIDVSKESNDTQYFLHVNGEKQFTMMGVATRSSKSCSGENLLERMQTQ